VRSPDAHAVRLKISMASLGSRDTMACPWDLASEYLAYCSKYTRVQAACRLTLKEEWALQAELAGVQDNRWALCLGLLTQQPQELVAPVFKVDFPQFDAVVDATALEDRKSASSWTQTLRKFSSAKPISYSRWVVFARREGGPPRADGGCAAPMSWWGRRRCGTLKRPCAAECRCAGRAARWALYSCTSS
jgi:hypothetical protein